jgi:hypothetical protein
MRLPYHVPVHLPTTYRKIRQGRVKSSLSKATIVKVVSIIDEERDLCPHMVPILRVPPPEG